MNIASGKHQPPDSLVPILYMLIGIAVCSILVLVVGGPLWLALKHESIAYLLWWVIPIGAGIGLELYSEEF